MRFAQYPVLGIIAAVGTAAAAQIPQTPNSPQLAATIACRAEADEGARLRCYDAAVAVLAREAQQGQLVVMSREDVRKAKRSLFGFDVPKLPFLGDDEREDVPQEIEGVVRNARSAGHGKWTVELDNGAVWQTTEGRMDLPVPKAGVKVRIKKAALGGYMLSVNGARGIRAMRVR